MMFKNNMLIVFLVGANLISPPAQATEHHQKPHSLDRKVGCIFSTLNLLSTLKGDGDTKLKEELKTYIGTAEENVITIDGVSLNAPLFAHCTYADGHVVPNALLDRLCDEIMGENKRKKKTTYHLNQNQINDILKDVEKDDSEKQKRETELNESMAKIKELDILQFQTKMKGLELSESIAKLKELEKLEYIAKRAKYTPLPYTGITTKSRNIGLTIDVSVQNGNNHRQLTPDEAEVVLNTLIQNCRTLSEDLPFLKVSKSSPENGESVILIKEREAIDPYPLFKILSFDVINDYLKRMIQIYTNARASEVGDLTTEWLKTQ